MEFEYLNQLDFDRERDGALHEIRKGELMYVPTGAVRKAYNEGFKAALRMIQKDYWNPDISDEIFEKLLVEVDKIDKPT